MSSFLYYKLDPQKIDKLWLFQVPNDLYWIQIFKTMRHATNVYLHYLVPRCDWHHRGSKTPSAPHSCNILREMAPTMEVAIEAPADKQVFKCKVLRRCLKSFRPNLQRKARYFSQLPVFENQRSCLWLKISVRASHREWLSRSNGSKSCVPRLPPWKMNLDSRGGAIVF